MEIFNALSAVIIGLVGLIIGIVIGGTIVDHNRDRQEARTKAREIDPMVGMTVSEAYLSGFDDGYHRYWDRKSRLKQFKDAGFSEMYLDGYRAGKQKREAESEVSL